MTAEFTAQDRTPRRIPAGVQILSILLFAGFAISTSIVAMVAFLPAGLGLAAFYAWQWGRIPTLSGGRPIADTLDTLRPDVPADAPRSSGNASFDAYRGDMIARLETEQTQFETFLQRLRDAKDKTEFDRFMDDRAARLDEDTPPVPLSHPRSQPHAA